VFLTVKTKDILCWLVMIVQI